MRAHKMHYLVVLNKHNRIEALNCSQDTKKSDTFLMELTKDDWYGIEDLIFEQENRVLTGCSKDTFMKYYNMYLKTEKQ